MKLIWVGQGKKCYDKPSSQNYMKITKSYPDERFWQSWKTCCLGLPAWPSVGTAAIHTLFDHCSYGFGKVCIALCQIKALVLHRYLSSCSSFLLLLFGRKALYLSTVGQQRLSCYLLQCEGTWDGLCNSPVREGRGKRNPGLIS